VEITVANKLIVGVGQKKNMISLLKECDFTGRIGRKLSSM